MPKIVAPSILSANFLNLGAEIALINDSKAGWIHVDIMDGTFVPNISIGFPVLDAVSKFATKPLDVHLMIQQPEKYIERFAKGGAAIITVHQEACPHLHGTLAQIKETGCRAGVAINPSTPVHLLEDIINEVDVLCLMSVNPGFGGQTFIPNTFKKLADAIKLIEKTGAKTLIEIDGGVTLANAAQLFNAGANVLVAGNTVFASKAPRDVIEQLANL